MLGFLIPHTQQRSPYSSAAVVIRIGPLEVFLFLPSFTLEIVSVLRSVSSTLTGGQWGGTVKTRTLSTKKVA